jgi:O-antigen ligase
MSKDIYKNPVIFISLLLSGCFIYVPQLVDYTLYSRFIYISISLLIIAGINLFVPGKTFLKVDYLILFYFLYVLFNIVSILWAINKAEAIFDSLRVSLGFLIFLISLFLMTSNWQKFIQIASKGIVILALAYLLISSILIFKIEQLTPDELSKTFIGFCSSKNSFTTFLYLLIPFLFYGIIKLSGVWRKISVVTLFGILWLLIVIQTRSVWLGIFINIILFFLYYFSGFKANRTIITAKAIALFSVLLILFVFLTFLAKSDRKEIAERVGSIFEYSSNISGLQSVSTSANIRLFLWQKSILMFQDKPVSGVGAGNWQINFPNYSITNLTDSEVGYKNYVNPHNDYLWILSENGLIGFLLIGFFVFALVILFIKYIYYEEDSNEKFIMFIFLIILIGHLIISFFDFPRQRIEHTAISNLILAIFYFKILQNSKRKCIQLSYSSLNKGFIALLIICSIDGFYRFRGETFVLKIYQARLERNWTKIIELCDKSYSKLYTIDPAGMPVHWFRGTANSVLKNYQDTYSDLLLAYKYNPYNKNVINDLGSINYKTGNKQKAIDLYKEALRISANFDEAKINLAVIYYNDGNYSETLKLINSTAKNNNSSLKQQLIKMLNEKNIY